MQKTSAPEAPNVGKTVGLGGGYVVVPTSSAGAFGPWCDLTELLPPDADCIMVLLNSGHGLNAGWPNPVGFIKLTGQLYLRDLHQLIKEHSAKNPDTNSPQWITVVPIRSSEYVDVWQRQKPKPPNT